MPQVVSIRSGTDAFDVTTAIVAAYQGAILLVDGSGVVTVARGGAAAPIAIDGAQGRPVHAVLALPDDAPAAGQLQLWLACAIGTSADLFQLSLGDPPRQLPAVAGRSAIELDYGPIFDGDGLTVAAAIFIKATADARGARAVSAQATDPEHLDRFFAETPALLETCNAELVKLATDHEARQSVHRMFRAMHTLKGAARCAGFGVIAELAHDIESRLAIFRERAHGVDAAEITAMQQELRQLGQQILADTPLDAVVDAMASLYGACRPALARAETALAAWDARVRDAALGADFARAVSALADVVEPFRMRGLAAQIATLVRLTEAARSKARPERRLIAGLDQALAALRELVELYRAVYQDVRACDSPTRVVRELVGAGGTIALRALAAREALPTLSTACSDSGSPAHVACLIEDLPQMFAPAPASLGARAPLVVAQRTLREAAATLRAAHRESPAELAAIESIAATAERLTWLGLDEVLRRTRRNVTTLASDLGKQVTLEVDAFGVVVPEAAHRVLSEVLLHAVRNAIDHGIERVDDRRTAGKPAAGTVRIAVATDRDCVQLDISDDGQGVDVERIRAKAIENKLIPPDAELSVAALHELVFHPGLSTAEQLTQVSGRGVGMDVIRSLAEDQGGSAELCSERGRGARLVVRVPLVTAARPR